MKNQTLLVIVNTIFWIGLAALLLTDPLRLAVGGSLLALVLGGYLLYAGLCAKVTRKMAEPGLARVLATTFGLTAIVFGIWVLVYALSGNVVSLRQARQQSLQEQLDQAARGYARLDLSSMGLRDIPPEVWELEHLTELDLSDNRLASLPPEVAQLVNLERLYLDGNRLEALPPEIGQLSHLEWLDLDGNRLTVLPPEFARLQSLTHLQIQYNRWTTFPAVILELPNLEQLFLAGNRLGELPPAITQRAATGELDLWYKPNASRVDWSSILVVVFTFVLPTVLSWGVNRWWTTRERTRQLAAQQEGAVFAIPPLFRVPLLFVTFGLTMISLFLLIVSLNGPQTGITIEAGVGISLLFAPLIISSLIVLLYNTGMVVLTAEGVSLRRAGRRCFLHYEDIVELKSQARILAPALLIRGAGHTLHIPRTIEHRPRLHELLTERVSSAVRDTALGKRDTLHTGIETISGTEAADAPVFTFRIRKRVWALYIVGTLLFILIYLGIGLMGLWIGLARGDVPPFTGRWARDTVFTFLLVSTIFAPALFFIIRSFFTQYGPFETRQPGALELYRDKIRYRPPHGPWQEHPARDLRHMTMTPLPVNVRARIDGAIVEQTVTRYMLVLEFTGGNRLVIDQERAAQFGESVERLHAIIKALYE